MSLHVVCKDGPLKDSSFTVPTCPQIVRCVKSVDGHLDILNLPEDEPRLDETVYWYKWDGTPHTPAHLYYGGRRGGEWISMVYLEAVQLEQGEAPRETDCRYGCCKAGDELLFSEAVPA